MAQHFPFGAAFVMSGRKLLDPAAYLSFTKTTNVHRKTLKISILKNTTNGLHNYIRHNNYK